MTPLSKNKQAKYMKEYRARIKAGVIPNSDSVIPKYPIGYMWPDGRCRLPDMTVVIPNQCQEFKIVEVT